MTPPFHLIGVGGIGMSALARILVQKGYVVSGSDIKDALVVRQLQEEGVRVFIGHSADQVPDGACVVYSGDVQAGNVECGAALSRGGELVHRAEMLARLMEGTAGLAVAGTHGKTTTSALLAHVLVCAKMDPSFAIGGILVSLQTNACLGRGRYFVIEADESDGSFLSYRPYGAIITNIDTDHMNYWGSLENLRLGFSRFAEQVAGPLVFCKDDVASMGFQGYSYGFSAQADARVTKNQEGVFTLTFRNVCYEDITTALLGDHNLLNAAAVFTLCLLLGIPEERIREGLSTFQGVRRRLEKKGEWRGALIYDDYGHHPTEIAATLRAARCMFSNKRLIVAFQPHRYTRTLDCMHLFKEALSLADGAVITDIYAAGESPIEGVTGEALAALCSVDYVPRDLLVDVLRRRLDSCDVLITMGAGDITSIGDVMVCG